MRGGMTSVGEVEVACKLHVPRKGSREGPGRNAARTAGEAQRADGSRQPGEEDEGCRGTKSRDEGSKKRQEVERDDSRKGSGSGCGSRNVEVAVALDSRSRWEVQGCSMFQPAATRFQPLCDSLGPNFVLTSSPTTRPFVMVGGARRSRFPLLPGWPATARVRSWPGELAQVACLACLFLNERRWWTVCCGSWVAVGEVLIKRVARPAMLRDWRTGGLAGWRIWRDRLVSKRATRTGIDG
ncbi:hypothetical protein BKA80DRAFT_140523 [Phyllosticta citrichinensis]